MEILLNLISYRTVGDRVNAGIKSINKVELCKAHLILNLFSGSKSNDEA